MQQVESTQGNLVEAVRVRLTREDRERATRLAHGIETARPALLRRAIEIGLAEIEREARRELGEAPEELAMVG